MAARLRQAYPSGVEVETFESYHKGKARKRVLRLLDTNHDGVLNLDEKQNARIIIYGHSWGGSATVAMARRLEKDGIPVLLTVQVDSISMFRKNDAVDPRERGPGRQFLPAPRPSARASQNSRCRSRAYPYSWEIFASNTKPLLTAVKSIPGMTASL